MATTEQRRLSEKSDFDKLHQRIDSTHDILVALGEKLDRLHEGTLVPQRDIPTVDELLLQAKSDPTARKALEATLAELEFSDPSIEFN